MAETNKKRGPGRPPGSKNKPKTDEAKARKDAPVDKEDKIKEMQEKRRADKKVIDEIWAVTIAAVGVFLIFCVQFKTVGVFGAAVHDVLRGLFGVIAYALPYFFIVCAVFLFMQKVQHINGRTVFFTVLIIICACMINAYRFVDPQNLRFGISDIATYYVAGVEGDPVGAIGMELASIVTKLIGKPGLIIFSIAVSLISILLVINTPISQRIEKAREKREAKKILREIENAEAEKRLENSEEPMVSDQPQQKRSIFGFLDAKQESETASDKQVAVTKTAAKPEKSLVVDETRREQFVDDLDKDDIGANADNAVGFGLDGVPSARSTGGLGLNDYDLSQEELLKSDAHKKEIKEYKKARSTSNKRATQPDEESEAAIAAEVAVGSVKRSSDYIMPPIDLLKKPQGIKNYMSETQLDERANLLENTLKNFNVEAKVIHVTQGSSVTRFEVQPASGVKVSKITSLADDIALNMRAKSIRIEAPIPGKAAVGIEIENEKANAVLIRELIESSEFANAKSKITFVVGKDISGNDVVADLKSMPHLLIAGATGSGKSVCINAIITSMLYKSDPDQVKFVMIDPKVVELGNYNDIPHMLIPVVTDPKKAASALNWAVNEMNQRYNKFAEAGVKDIESFNEYSVANQEAENVLPEIVIIIDELADLMMAASSQVEDAISRLAAKARAAGMHLIVATQRPSVDVVTGVIKANIPSRIAFSVSSQFDSRTILDMAGAEKLLGKGDMLFSPVGSNKPLRIQGPFITEDETRKLINYVKKQKSNEFNEDVMKSIETPAEVAGGSGELSDELTDDAIAFILKQKQASVSMLQRRFRIGYNRAARIIDEIEERGIIGPSDGARPRQVLYTEDEYYRMLSGESQDEEVDSQEYDEEPEEQEVVTEAEEETDSQESQEEDE